MMSFLALVLATIVCETVWKSSSLYTCNLCTFVSVYYILKNTKRRHKVRALGNVKRGHKAVSPTALDV